jgi:hypothetical protein
VGRGNRKAISVENAQAVLVEVQASAMNKALELRQFIRKRNETDM